MSSEKIVYRPIGTIRTPFKKIKGTPIQSIAAKGKKGTIHIKPECADGLKDLEGFSHVILLYHFHKTQRCSLRVKPFLDTHARGVFATRATVRPNPIGISVVKLVEIRGTTITVNNIDVVDGTPLLDIKPYVPAFDVHQVQKIGWLTTKIEDASHTQADDRFV
jgi:tRNA-Thr(GGU) m(6)t(6)A37 methyltransferase TsaA